MKSTVSKSILVVGLLLSIWLLTGSIIAAAIILAVIGPMSVATFQEARRVAEENARFSDELQVVEVPVASTATLNERLQASLAKHPDSGVSLMPPGVRAFLRENKPSDHVVIIKDGKASVVSVADAASIASEAVRLNGLRVSLPELIADEVGGSMIHIKSV